MQPIFYLTSSKQHLVRALLVSGRGAYAVQITNCALHNHKTITDLKPHVRGFGRAVVSVFRRSTQGSL